MRIIKAKISEICPRTERVAIGCQGVREYKILSEKIYEDKYPLNHLVRSIHICRAQEIGKTSYEDLVFIKNRYMDSYDVMNDSLINLLTCDDINVCVSDCGGIIIWDKHAVYSTIDMQQLDFHIEMDEILRQYSIIFLSDNYMTLKKIDTNKPEARRIKIEIDLSSTEQPVKILFL